MSDLMSPGLRERKRVETRARLETAAVEIALRDGLDRTTVDAISEAAVVSPRTFFNYFESKEDAIVGLRDFEVSDELLLQHGAKAAAGDLVGAVIDLLLGLMRPMLGDADLHRSRMLLMRQHPHLLGRQVAQMTRMADTLTDYIEAFMASSARFGTTAASPMAAAILALCGSSVRSAIKEWIAAGSDPSMESIRIRANSLAREVLEVLR